MTRAMTPGRHPPDRAKKLKKAWVQKVKIKSKWRAEKRKAGLLPPSLPPSERSRGKESPSEPKADPDSLMDCQEQPPAQPSEQTQHSVRDGPSFRDLRKNAYSNFRERGDSSGRKGQPDMKSRMNALLAKIKRDHQN